MGARGAPGSETPAGRLPAGASVFPTFGGLVKRVILSLLACAVVAGGFVGHVGVAKANRVFEDIATSRSATWKWQKLMGAPRTPTSAGVSRLELQHRHWVIREL